MQPIQASGEKGWKSKEAKTTQVGQGIAKDSQVKETQKGSGNIHTLVLHSKVFQTTKEM